MMGIADWGEASEQPARGGRFDRRSSHRRRCIVDPSRPGEAQPTFPALVEQRAALDVASTGRAAGLGGSPDVGTADSVRGDAYSIGPVVTGFVVAAAARDDRSRRRHLDEPGEPP